jgi:putative phage-type endonuclease
MFKIKEKKAANETWTAERRKGIGGSDLAPLMGISPYRTAYSLWLEKTGRVTPPDISGLPHVQRGITNEPIARALFEQQTGKNFKPKSWVVPNSPWRCNDDGYNHDFEAIFECKVQSRAKHEATQRGEVPDHYRLQCEYNLAVSKAKLCYFASFWPETEELAVVEIRVDLERREKLLAIVLDWWNEHVVKDIPPALTPKDRIDLTDEYAMALCREYKRVKALDDVDESLRLRLHELTSVARPSVVCDGVTITMSFDGHYRITIKD